MSEPELSKVEMNNAEIKELQRIVALNEIPSLNLMLLRAAVTRKQKQPVPKFGDLELRVKGSKVDREALAKYNKVCGLPDADTLPLTYPSVMGFPLLIKALTEPEFPFGAMGNIHLSNKIVQQRPIKIDEVLDFEVSFGDHTEVAKGYVITLKSRVKIAGEPVWSSESTMLVKAETAAADNVSRIRSQEPDYQNSELWELSSSLGREYASVSGDYNPIHLWPQTAKLMGLKGHIMHGMWTKARALATLMPTSPERPVTVDVAFKLPVFLPATVSLHWANDEQGGQFAVKDKKGRRPHMVGTISFQ